MRGLVLAHVVAAAALSPHLCTHSTSHASRHRALRLAAAGTDDDDLAALDAAAKAAQSSADAQPRIAGQAVR